jgi:hypothetical protein
MRGLPWCLDLKDEITTYGVLPFDREQRLPQMRCLQVNLINEDKYIKMFKSFGLEYAFLTYNIPFEQHLNMTGNPYRRWIRMGVHHARVGVTPFLGSQ